MDIKDRNSDFREADRKYAELARKRDAGDISAEEFDAERKRLMVLDKQGRWWAKSSSTGEWNYHDGKAWVKGVPPGYEPQSDAAPAKEIPERRTQPERTQAPSSEGQAREVADEGGRSRVLRWNPILLLALLLFILIGGTTYALTRGTSEPGGDIAVPDLVGASSIEEARSIVGGDFEIVEADGVESQEPIGAVVDQDPAPGESVGEGSTISVNVSKGVDVPDIEGERRDEAAQVLEDAGFEVEEETEESSEEDEGL
ncbi:MAG: PASTA domain-containing protein, partial [Rubrobacteraceae bacterium]